MANKNRNKRISSNLPNLPKPPIPNPDSWYQAPNFNIDQAVMSRNVYEETMITAENLYDWQGLPQGLSGFKLERMLIEYGKVSLFNTLEGFYVLPFSQSNVNIYNEPVSVTPVANQSSILSLIDTTPRILYDNPRQQSIHPLIRAYCEDLSELQKTISILERELRMPYIIAVSEQNKESYQRFITKVNQGYPVIVVDDAFNTQNINVFNTGNTSAALMQAWDSYYKKNQQLYHLFGILYNPQMGKMSGVNIGETLMEMASLSTISGARLKLREQWATDMNAEFGMNIIVTENATNKDNLIKLVGDLGNQNIDGSNNGGSSTIGTLSDTGDKSEKAGDK